MKQKFVRLRERRRQEREERQSKVTYVRKWLSVSGRRSKVRQQLRQRDGDYCCWCGDLMNFEVQSSVDYATIEHLVPVSRGGKNSMKNLALAHARCNFQRGVRPSLPVNTYDQRSNEL